jgi:hypothetical protein
VLVGEDHPERHPWDSREVKQIAPMSFFLPSTASSFNNDVAALR